jgi:hypothetical protein
MQPLSIDAANASRPAGGAGAARDRVVRWTATYAVALTHSSYDPRLAVTLLVAAADAQRELLIDARTQLEGRREDRPAQQAAHHLLSLGASGGAPPRRKLRDIAIRAGVGRLPLHPGDRRIQSVVHPSHHGLTRARGTWGCRRCTDELAIRDSWTVLLSSRHSEVPYAAMVCRACAADLVPVRLTLDLHRLGAAEDDQTTREVTALADRARPRRDDGRDRLLGLRAADTLRLVRRFALPPGEVLLRLRDVGLVAGIDCLARVPAGRPDRTGTS